MNRKARFFLTLCLVCSLLLAMLPAGAEGPAEAAFRLTDGGCETLDQLFEAGETALAEGAAPEAVVREMYRLAAENGFGNEFLYTAENIAGQHNKTHITFSGGLGFGLFSWQDRRLSLNTPPRAADEALGWDAYAARTCSEAMKKALADADAQFCITPCFWWNCFEDLAGVAFQKFVPLRPRGGYACVVQNQEGVDTTFVNRVPDIMKKTLDDLTEALGESAPVFTGNPHLASTFWNITLETPFYAFYGKTRSVAGYDVVLTVEVLDAATKKSIAKLQERSRLPNTITAPSGNNAYATVPVLSSSAKYDAFVKKVRTRMEGEWQQAAENPRVTALSAEQILRDTLAREAEGVKDPWLAAIYSAGPEAVSMSGSEVTFTVRDYAFPELSQSDAGGAEDWLREVVRQALLSRAEVQVQVENGGLAAKGLKSLKTELSKKASVAQKTFGGKEWTAALKATLFPVPAEGKIREAAQLTPDEAFAAWLERHAGWVQGAPAEAWAALFYAQKSQTLSVKEGPESFRLDCTGTGPEALLEQARQGTLEQWKKEGVGRESTREEIEPLFLSQLAEAAIRSHGSGREKIQLTFRAEDLLAEEAFTDYRAFLDAFAYEAVLEQTCGEAATP